MTGSTNEALFDQAVRLHGSGRLEEAEVLYRQVLGAPPGDPAARQWQAAASRNLGILLTGKNEIDQALPFLQRAVALRPEFAEAHFSLANALGMASRLDETINHYRRALALRPDYPEACNNLAIALRRAGRLEESLAAARRGIDLRPNHFEAINSLGAALKELGRYDEALAAYRQAVALRPDWPAAHFNVGCTLLLQGDLERGFAEYDWPWKHKDAPTLRRGYSGPRWDGTPLNGRRIVLYAEQGFGDAIHFVRYAPIIAGLGGTVIVECQQPLRRLLARMPSVAQVVTREEPLPDFDEHCALMSLPFVMKTTAATIPADVPYLSADATEVGQWKSRIAESEAAASAIKIGLVWAGNPRHMIDRARSISLLSLAPLAQTAGAHFFSLQKGEGSAQAAAPPTGMRLTDWTADLGDFADTAALIANLDLVITVDTSVAHLAAALAKPTWLLLPFVPDWRWMLGRSDSPWYPTVRLFRQPKLDDWQTPIDEMAAALRAHAIAQSI